MRNRKPTNPAAKAMPSLTWTAADMERLCWDAGVLTKAIVHGFRKAATEAFMDRGYRLATISRDFEPFSFIHKLSLYMLGDQPRLGRREAKKLARSVMKEIGIRPKSDECMAELSGRRLVVTVGLPQWAWPRL